MSAQIPPPGPGGPDDLERRLAAAMRAEADRVMPAGDGLAKIGARTAGNRAGAFAWLRPQALLGGAAAVTVIILGVAATSQLTGGGGGTTVVERPPDPIVGASTQPFAVTPLNTQMSPDPTPEAPIGPAGGEDPTPNAEITVPKIALPQPVTEDQEHNRSDGGIPVDDGVSNYVAIQSPFSGTTTKPVFTIAGLARVYEAQVTIDISQNGKVLKQAHAMATEGAPALGDWQVTVELAPGNYRIDAYALSPEDGIKRLATDSIWITVKPDAATPSATPSATVSPSSTATASRRVDSPIMRAKDGSLTHREMRA